MFPKPSLWERMRRKPPSVYGSIEHIFYAFKTDEPQMIPDMWDKGKPLMQISSPEGSTYFSLDTMVGVVAKGQNNIRSVHIRFVLMPMQEHLPEPEVVSITPTNISRTVGEIREMQKYENERSAGGGVKASGGYGSKVARVGASIGAGFRKQFLSSKIKESTLPNELLIANASGTTNRAIWEFYRGDGIEAIGQYNLKIIFRLRESPQYEERFCYCADWNVEVNGRKLWDHRIERENDKWNVEVNGRKLMAHVDDTNTKQDHECENYVQKDGVRYYRTIEPKMKQSLLQKLFSRKRTEKQDSITKRIVKLIQEDDPDIDKRLLRPLILLESSDKPPQSKNLKPSPSSWKTKIKDIDSCPSLMVEATVLSNPKKIEIQRNCKRDTRYIVTYLLLGDDTGVIVLIDEKLDKLNQCKMGDKVRVIGAEGKEVLYPDLGGIQRILKYRHTDLYVNKSTCIEKCEDKISTARSATR